MNIAYIGNFGPPHSTENEVRKALTYNGHQVIPLQENGIEWRGLAELAKDAAFVLWTRTWTLDADAQRAGLDEVRKTKPVVGYHLDRWWGLERQREVLTHPFFSHTDLLCTADGGHDLHWKAAGIEHHWFPPAVSFEATQLVGQLRPEFDFDVGFAGQHRIYHPEWLPYRRALVNFLERRYGKRFGIWPKHGDPAVRGQDLCDLYRSVKVVVGDSCLAGQCPMLPQGVRGGAHRYFSDRIPETLGRGGFLIHPDFVGLTELYKPAEHLVTYELGNFIDLALKIDQALEMPEARLAIAGAGKAWVIAEHTYERRMESLIELISPRL